MIKIELTKKQKVFVNEYLADKELNATKAYMNTYKNCKTEKTASAAASRLMKNEKIAEYIEKKMKEREERTEITQDRVLKELAVIGFAKASDYAQIVEKRAFYTTKEGQRVPLYDENGEPILIRDVEMKLTKELGEEQMRAISSIKCGRYGIEVVPYDKVKALELMGRHLGMWKDKVELSGKMDWNNPYANLSTKELKRLIKSG